jgi:hypothetical protein
MFALLRVAVTAIATAAIGGAAAQSFENQIEAIRVDMLNRCVPMQQSANGSGIVTERQIETYCMCLAHQASQALTPADLALYATSGDVSPDLASRMPTPC